jgi:hypothetical protein
MFYIAFSDMACALQAQQQSRNNKNGPNNNNDVITDLGGEGDFPMFLSGLQLAPKSAISSLSIFLVAQLPCDVLARFWRNERVFGS